MSPFDHTPYYCEENIWRLCRHERFCAAKRSAVFISNAQRQCAMWNQRAGPEAGGPIVWDYHVVMLAEAGAGWEVWDLDCLLGAPLPARVWFDGSFLGLGALRPRFRPTFRVVDADIFAEVFSSDRGHMRRPDGSFLQPPPAWEAIGEGPSNLMSFVDMSGNSEGEVISGETFLALYGALS